MRTIFFCFLSDWKKTVFLFRLCKNSQMKSYGNDSNQYMRDCRFFSKGYCRYGNLCRFSHSTTGFDERTMTVYMANMPEYYKETEVKHLIHDVEELQDSIVSIRVLNSKLHNGDIAGLVNYLWHEIPSNHVKRCPRGDVLSVCVGWFFFLLKI